MVIIEILLDGGQENIVHAGQEVRGNIQVETRDEIKMRGIRIEVSGAATVAWTEGTRKNRRHYSGQQNFIGLKKYITGSDKKDSELFIKPGVHTFPLSFVLPNTLPPSFAGAHGSIRYKVQAIIDRAWKIDDSTEIVITVVRLLDLNRLPPQLKEPVVKRADKPTVGCCYHFCCIRGHPEIELRINRGCFVPGEKIIINGELVNKSSANISAIVINFMQEIEFCANSGGHGSRRKHEYKTLATKQRPEIESGRTDTWSDVTFTVPSTVAPRLDGCKIINIKHYILVKADFSRGCADSAVRQDVVIGHIPLQGVSQLGGPITTQPSVYPSQPPFQPGPQLLPEQSNHSGVHGSGWNQDNSTAAVGHR